MDKIKQELLALKQEATELSTLKNQELREHFEEEYGVYFDADFDYNEFVDLTTEDNGCFDPFDFVMDEKDVICFLKWCYRKFLIANITSVSGGIESILNGETHNSKKQLEKDVSDMRKYKKQIEDVISISKATIEKMDKLINIADNYRK